MQKDILSKIISRFYHDTISSLHGIKMCLEMRSYDLAFKTIEDNLQKALSQRDRILYDHESQNKIPSINNEEVTFALRLILNEYELCIITLHDNNVIQIENRYFDSTNIWIIVAKSILDKHNYTLQIKNKYHTPHQ